MSKIIRISLVASLVAASFANAGTLAEAFKASKINGEIKSELSSSNFLGQSQYDSISAIGGHLGIVTGSYYGLKAGVTFQTSHVINLSDSDNSGTFGSRAYPIRNSPVDISGSILSEAYLQYTLSNTTLKVGRQYIDTPLVRTAVDGKATEGIIKDSFEAYLLTNTDIPNTTLIAGYISKYQAKRDSAGSVGQFKKFQDGAYTIYARNTSVNNLTLQAQYLDENGKTSATDKSAFYIQGDYKLGHHTLSAQYLQSNDKTKPLGKQDGKILGFQVTGPLGIGHLGYLALYSNSMDNGAVYTGAGVGTTDTLFTSVPINGGDVPARANTQTGVLAIIVPVSKFVFIPYYGESFRSNGPGRVGNVKAMGAMALYHYNKNFSTKAAYEHVNTENTIAGPVPKNNTNVARLYLSYKF